MDTSNSGRDFIFDAVDDHVISSHNNGRRSGVQNEATVSMKLDSENRKFGTKIVDDPDNSEVFQSTKRRTVARALRDTSHVRKLLVFILFSKSKFYFARIFKLSYSLQPFLHIFLLEILYIRILFAGLPVGLIKGALGMITLYDAHFPNQPRFPTL